MENRPTSRLRAVRSIYRNAWFEVEEREVEGFDQPYFVVAAVDYATVLPLLPDGTALFVRQYRPAMDCVTLELPSGHVDAGERPDQSVVRELREETGCETTELIPLGPLASNTGRMNNRLWAYVARVRQVGAAEVGIDVHACHVSEIPRMVREGQLGHALDLSVLMKAACAGYLPPLTAAAPG